VRPQPQMGSNSNNWGGTFEKESNIVYGSVKVPGSTGGIDFAQSAPHAAATSSGGQSGGTLYATHRWSSAGKVRASRV
jgi:hypothetical protein